MLRKKWFHAVWIGVLALCVIGVVRFRARTALYYLPSGSMSPTLKIGDRVLVDKQAYTTQAPSDGDITIFRVTHKQLYENKPGSVDFVKRVVGTPGERVEMKKGVLLVNSKPVKEPYIVWSGGPRYDMKVIKGAVYYREIPSDGSGGYWLKDGVIVSEQNQKVMDKAPTEPLPADKFLALGDNRGNSNDSHTLGFVDREAFVGRVVQLVLPLERGRKF